MASTQAPKGGKTATPKPTQTKTSKAVPAVSAGVGSVPRSKAKPKATHTPSNTVEVIATNTKPAAGRIGLKINTSSPSKIASGASSPTKGGGSPTKAGAVSPIKATSPSKSSAPSSATRITPVSPIKVTPWSPTKSKYNVANGPRIGQNGSSGASLSHSRKTSTSSVRTFADVSKTGLHGRTNSTSSVKQVTTTPATPTKPQVPTSPAKANKAWTTINGTHARRGSASIIPSRSGQAPSGRVDAKAKPADRNPKPGPDAKPTPIAGRKKAPAQAPTPDAAAKTVKAQVAEAKAAQAKAEAAQNLVPTSTSPPPANPLHPPTPPGAVHTLDLRRQERYDFEYLPNFFCPTQWLKDIDDRFGLHSRFHDWTAFKSAIKDMQSRTKHNEDIKVLFAARHGEAEHNALAQQHPELGDDKVHLLYPIVDPNLTEAGRNQAIQLGSAFRREAKLGMPVPARWFVSPMRRPGETCGLEWGWLFRDGGRDVDHSPVRTSDMGHNVPAVVVEDIREHLHVHRCDERLGLHELRPLFPSFSYPEDMPNDDVVWRPWGRETEDEMVARAGRGLATIFDRCGDETYVSMTAHSGLLRAVFKNLRVPPRRLATGEMNVLVVRVTRL